MRCLNRRARVREDLLEAERDEPNAIGFEELVLELDPVEAQGVEEALQHVHHQEDASGDGGEDGKADEGREEVHVDGGEHRLLPEDAGELGVGEGEGPQTEVRGSVGDHAEDELDGFDGLVDKDFSEAVFLVVAVAVVTSFEGGVRVSGAASEASRVLVGVTVL